MAAPASAAPIALSAICAGVMGRCGDMLGVWIEPVMAQLMMTFSAFFNLRPSFVPSAVTAVRICWKSCGMRSEDLPDAAGPQLR